MFLLMMMMMTVVGSSSSNERVLKIGGAEAGCGALPLVEDCTHSIVVLRLAKKVLDDFIRVCPVGLVEGGPAVGVRCEEANTVIFRSAVRLVLTVDDIRHLGL